MNYVVVVPISKACIRDFGVGVQKLKSFYVQVQPGVSNEDVYPTKSPMRLLHRLFEFYRLHFLSMPNGRTILVVPANSWYNQEEELARILQLSHLCYCTPC